MTWDQKWAERRAKDFAYKKSEMEKQLDIKKGEPWQSVLTKLLVAWYDLQREVDRLKEGNTE